VRRLPACRSADSSVPSTSWPAQHFLCYGSLSIWPLCTQPCPTASFGARLACVLCYVVLSRWIGRHAGSVRKLLGGSGKDSSPAIDTLQTLEEDTELSREEFKKLLETIDSGLRALPATAQVTHLCITHACCAVHTCGLCRPPWPPVGQPHKRPLLRVRSLPGLWGLADAAGCVVCKWYVYDCLCRLHLQVAKQEGEYLASVLVSGQFDEQQSTFKLPEKAGPFK
jgi:hypothetical protein